jgi:hypothetical protein
MARFDPHSYPDRLGFEAYAHRVRQEALRETFAPLAAWLAGRWHALAAGAARVATPAMARAHRNPAR